MPIANQTNSNSDFRIQPSAPPPSNRVSLVLIVTAVLAALAALAALVLLDAEAVALGAAGVALGSLVGFLANTSQSTATVDCAAYHDEQRHPLPAQQMSPCPTIFQPGATATFFIPSGEGEQELEVSVTIPSANCLVTLESVVAMAEAEEQTHAVGGFVANVYTLT